MESSKDVKVLGALGSAYTQRVEWALRSKGIEYEVIEADLYNKSPLLLQLNPVYKKVPVLIHAGKPVSESSLIIEYIDEVWENNPIMPQDPYERAMARFWAQFAEEKFTKVIQKAIFLQGEELEKKLEEAKEALKLLEGELKDKKFFGGDKIGLVDLSLGWMTNWREAFEEVCGFTILDSDQNPLIYQWVQRVLELPEVNVKLPKKEDLVHYFSKARQLAFEGSAERPWN